MSLTKVNNLFYRQKKIAFLCLSLTNPTFYMRTTKSNLPRKIILYITYIKNSALPDKKTHMCPCVINISKFVYINTEISDYSETK